VGPGRSIRHRRPALLCAASSTSAPSLRHPQSPLPSGCHRLLLLPFPNSSSLPPPPPVPGGPRSPCKWRPRPRRPRRGDPLHAPSGGPASAVALPASPPLCGSSASGGSPPLCSSRPSTSAPRSRASPRRSSTACSPGGGMLSGWQNPRWGRAGGGGGLAGCDGANSPRGASRGPEMSVPGPST
jgi:hypothetical protein